ncbi:MAG: molybdopterin-dependent oxidoreductase [Candidatus Cloacimonetes bacterium]|nr:molybdopterin-dependent oxidoreductase [Candidatus Cloacimonadota bacterium]
MNFKEVKHSIPKVDGKGLLTGAHAYTNDLASDNALIIKLLRSPHAFAKIKSIGTKQASNVEGVECILTYKDVPRIPITRAGQGYPEPSPKDKFILDYYVRYIGDEVAIVAATNEKAASDAIKLIEVEYEVLKPVLDFEKAEGNETVIHPESEIYSMFPIGLDAKNNIACSYIDTMIVGDIEKTLKESDFVVSERYYTHAQQQTAMEPHTSSAFIDVQGRLNIFSSTQNPYHTRRIIGEALNKPLRDIRVYKPRIGGGFGAKQQIHNDLFSAIVTLKTGKPSKCFYTRKEVNESTFTRHQMRIDVQLGADKNGNLKAFDMQVLSNTGAYGEHSLTTFMVAGSKLLPMYNKAVALRFEGKVVYTNKCSAGAFRGYGAIQANFAVESAIDELAAKMNIDPVELRLKNCIKEGETSPVFRVMGEGGEGIAQIMDSCKLDHCIKRGKKLIKWKEKFPSTQVSSNKIRSVGAAIAMQGSGIPLLDMGSAVLKLNDDGFFNLLVGATDIGTGSDTVLSQIAAEAIGVPVDRIVITSSDTDTTPYDVGAYASSTTFVSGNAARKAGLNMRVKLIDEAARVLQAVHKDDIVFEDCTFKLKNTDQSITLKDLSEGLYYKYGADMKQLIASGSNTSPKSPPPFMAGFVEIEVDTETGKIDILDYVGVVDCGTPINPNLAKIQVEGGILQGIGMAMFEDVRYSESGQMLTNNLMKYKIPNRKDVKKLTVEFAESYDPAGPYGAKSVGEIGIDTPLAAVANAIYNATGVRIRKLPITPESVLIGINKLKS